ncbi:hypothetical protein KC19_5G089900 [Ceratodon purpureus]|uniref:Uncharacterized protein n=1 Tax=Ceratodon purpureus TaxID=3225 RepID=A0A8T0I0M0_CERPU|nr:hypothetical protein KC19_5G089900 [Ceratodon purpureus]
MYATTIHIIGTFLLCCPVLSVAAPSRHRHRHRHRLCVTLAMLLLLTQHRTAFLPRVRSSHSLPFFFLSKEILMSPRA